MFRISIARLAALLLCAPFLLFLPHAQAATRDCADAATLEALTDCISLQMPQHGSRDYIVPTAAQRADFRDVVARMLAGECAFALPAGLAPMRMRPFADAVNGRTYCLVMEVDDADNDGYVDRGWGTFIVYRDATREIAHQAPHPKFSTSSSGDAGDSYTEREAIRIFKRTDSRSYLMCGARRSAVPQASSCQRDYEVADCAHNIDTLFHAATEAMNAFYGDRDWTAIQWHGMAASSCRETMFMSLGFDKNPPAGSKILALRDAIRAKRPSWIVNTPDTACTLNATQNPAGRMLNGVPSAQSCGTSATAPSHKFMHIEQDVPVIGADLEGVSNSWAEAINASFNSGGGGTAQKLRSVADSYVRDGANAGTNYGGVREMQIKGGGSGGVRMGFLKFDLGTAASVSRAVLRLHIAQNIAGASLTLNAHAVPDTTWTESALNWNNKPAMSTRLAAVTTSGATSFAWYEFDVTAQVQAELASGRKTLAFGLATPNAGGTWAKVRAKEAASNRPELVLTP